MQSITPPHIDQNINSDTHNKPNNNAISSITKGPRQSNFELLRIVAMFMVLIVHADFLSLGRPTYDEYINTPMSSICRVFFETFAIICVNVFVLISGWFTIKSTLKGACNFLFQCSFIIIAVYCIGQLGGLYHPRMSEWIFIGIFYDYGFYWFIRAYLILYILAPILNYFVNNAPKRTIIFVLLSFFSIQSIGIIQLFSAPNFRYGYSPLSFVGLYLLAQTIRLHYPNYRIRTAYILFFGSFGLNTAYFLIVNFCSLWDPIDFLAYSNPLVILQAVGLLMIFNRIHIRPNKFINWISASSFAVYLVHTNPAIIDYFKSSVLEIYNNTNSVECLVCIFGVLCAVFAASVLIDQPRKFIWKYLQRVFPTTSKVESK
ncbi:MAG: acyltransferase [Muribaculaceae bacterium]|nr:acyltransferase [Muribaculaceae bacterium]